MREDRDVTITEFLLARIAEDEVAAKRGRSHPDPTTFARDNYGYLWVQPDRVLAECEAKRRIIEEYRIRVAQDADEDDWGSREITTARCEELESVLRLLARINADHPDFDPAWRT